MRALLRGSHAAVLALSLATAGCLGSTQTSGPGHIEGQVSPVEVPDAEFAENL